MYPFTEHLLYAKLPIRLSLQHGDVNFQQSFTTFVRISLGQRRDLSHITLSLFFLKIFLKWGGSILAWSPGFSFWDSPLSGEQLLESELEPVACSSFCWGPPLSLGQWTECLAQLPVTERTHVVFHLTRWTKVAIKASALKDFQTDQKLTGCLLFQVSV